MTTANKLFPDYKTVKTSNLIPYARNSRTHSEQQVSKIAASIKEFGFLNPVIVDGNNGIVAGHGRVLAAQKLGLDELPVIEASHLTEAQRRAYVIADNRLALDAGWDDEMLRVEFADLAELDFDLELTGFTADEINALTIEELPEGLTDEDSVPDVPETPITVLGDVWLLGKHRVMCGDSTSIDAVEKLMDGSKADMVFTDPPYLIQTEGGCRGSIGKGLEKQGQDIEFISSFDTKEFLSILPLVFAKSCFNAYIFCNKDLLPDYLLWARDNGISFNVLVWKKPTAIPIGGSHRPDIEYLLVFRKSAIWNGGIEGVNYSRLIECGRETGLHPTMKPISMLENQLRISSNASSIVLDMFGGSGSTLIACEKTGRINRIIELDPKYCDVIVKRWQEFTGKAATLESSGKTFSEVLNEQDRTSAN